jgi:hypothetical protein
MIPMGSDALRPFMAGLKDPADGAMRPYCVKITNYDHARLYAQARRLSVYPSALARTIIAAELDRLEAECE